MGGKPGAIKTGVVLAFRNVIYIPQNEQKRQDKTNKQTNKQGKARRLSCISRESACLVGACHHQYSTNRNTVQSESALQKLSDKAKPSGSFQYGKGSK